MGDSKKYPCRHPGCDKSYQSMSGRWRHEGHHKKAKKVVKTRKYVKKIEPQTHIPVVPRFCYNCGCPYPSKMLVEAP